MRKQRHISPGLILTASLMGIAAITPLSAATGSIESAARPTLTAAPSQRSGSFVRCIDKAARQFCQSHITQQPTQTRLVSLDTMPIRQTVTTAIIHHVTIDLYQPSLIDLPPPYNC